MPTIREQIRNNSVALISLVIAVSSLGYNTWRNETTERQRNIRHASFRVLESLGELQETVDYRYYYLPFQEAAHAEGESRLRGYGSVAMVRDLMDLMPAPAPAAGQDLHRHWIEQFNALDDLDGGQQHTEAATRAERELTAAIKQTREAVVMVLRELE